MVRGTHDYRRHSTPRTHDARLFPASGTVRFTKIASFRRAHRRKRVHPARPTWPFSDGPHGASVRIDTQLSMFRKWKGKCFFSRLRTASQRDHRSFQQTISRLRTAVRRDQRRDHVENQPTWPHSRQ